MEQAFDAAPASHDLPLRIVDEGVVDEALEVLKERPEADRGLGRAARGAERCADRVEGRLRVQRVVSADLAPREGELLTPFTLALVVCRTPEALDEEREPPVEERRHRIGAEERGHAQEEGDLLLERARVAPEERLERARDVSDGVPVAVRLAPERAPVALAVEAQHVYEEPVDKGLERAGCRLRLLPRDTASMVFQVLLDGFSHAHVLVWSDAVILLRPPRER